MIRRKATILQKTRLSRLVRPARRGLPAELGAPRAACERPPIRPTPERRIHQGIRHPVPAELGGDADRALSALRVPVDVVFRETPVVDDTARSEPGDHLLRGGRLKTLRAQLRVQLRPREIAPGEQCDGCRPHCLGIRTLLLVCRFRSAQAHRLKYSAASAAGAPQPRFPKSLRKELTCDSLLECCSASMLVQSLSRWPIRHSRRRPQTRRLPRRLPLPDRRRRLLPPPRPLLPRGPKGRPRRRSTPSRSTSARKGIRWKCTTARSSSVGVKRS